jgi:hypothetical protein
LIQIFKDVDELLLPGIIPLTLAFLKLHDQFPQLPVLLQVLAELMSVVSFSDLSRHHLQLIGDFFLLLLEILQSS